MKRIVLFLIVGVLGDTIAQSTHRSLLDGSKAYQAEDYDKAIQHFRSATTNEDDQFNGHYNLGNALYKTKSLSEAIQSYTSASNQSTEKQQQAKASFNLGNAHLEAFKQQQQQQQQQQPMQAQPPSDQTDHLKKAIEAYKTSLRSDPTDFDTKNNLSVAYKYLQQQQQQQQQQQKQEQQKNKDQQKEEQQKQEQQKEQKNKEQQQQEPKSKKELEKEELERMLKRVEEDDKRVQEKLMERKKANRRKPEKDW